MDRAVLPILDATFKRKKSIGFSHVGCNELGRIQGKSRDNLSAYTLALPLKPRKWALQAASTTAKHIPLQKEH
jgi:hypothetical protein